MLIDWFTVAAQIVNFVVLVGLLKHFLYGPLVRAIDARETRIAAQLAEAGQKAQQAETQIEEAQKQVAELDKARTQTLADARSEAERQEHALVQAARASVRALEAKWREDLRLEEAAFLNEIRHAASAEIVAISRRALKDLAGVDVDRCAIQVFFEKLSSIDATVLRQLSGGELSVVTATERTPEAERQIRETIERRVGGPVTLHFEQAPEMAWGIELRGSGQRIGWTPDGYLDSLEEKLRNALDERADLGAPVAVE